MNLYIKQKVFSIGDQYTVYDIDGNPVYFVEGEIFTIGAKMRLKNIRGEELFFIKQNLRLLLAEYEIYQGNELFAVVNQKFALFKSNLAIDSKLGSFEVIGDFFSWDYEIRVNNRTYGYLHKKFLSWGDTYELAISDDADPAFFVALVVTIDNCLHNESEQ